MSRGECAAFRAALDRGDPAGASSAHAAACAACARELAAARALRAGFASPDRSVPPAFARRMATLSRLDASEWARKSPRRDLFPTPAFTWSLAAAGLGCAAIVAGPPLYEALAAGMREMAAGSRELAASLGGSFAYAVAVPPEWAAVAAGVMSFAGVFALFVVRRARAVV